MKTDTTVGKRNYFTAYGILLHELPVVEVLELQDLHVVKYGINLVK